MSQKVSFPKTVVNNVGNTYNDVPILTEQTNLLMENHYHEFKFLANLWQNL